MHPQPFCNLSPNLPAPTAFLLRFQESCLSDQVIATAAGTRTETRVLAEQQDSDACPTDYRTLVGQVGSCPPTRTLIRAESPDYESADHGFSIPRRPAIPSCATKTITYVRAEADDNDPRQPTLNAIPRCS